jgi:hypothetical protein
MFSGSYYYRDFEKAVDYNDIRYYGPEDDRFNGEKGRLVYQVMGL